VLHRRIPKFSGAVRASDFFFQRHRRIVAPAIHYFSFFVMNTRRMPGLDSISPKLIQPFFS
jgi:hypothetical protein